MKNTSIIYLLRSLVLVGCFSLLIVGASDAGQEAERSFCKVKCSKNSSVYQQRCSASYYNPKSRVFHNTDALISCVQSLRSKIDICEKWCLRSQKLLTK